MKSMAFVIIFLGGGVALYPFINELQPAGHALNRIYSWFTPGLSVDVATRLSVSYFYASLFHLVWSALLGESASVWGPTVRGKDLVYLALRCLGYWLVSLITLGLVGMTSQKVPYSDFHRYFSYLVMCMLIGVWAGCIRDFVVAAVYYVRGKRV